MPLSVLVLYDRQGATGVSRVANIAASGLHARGLRVIRMAWGATGEEAIDNADCYASGPRANMRLVQRLRRTIIQERIRIVHAHHRRLALLSMLACRGTSTRVVEHVHSVFDDRRILSFRCHATVALTPRLAQGMLMTYPHVRGRLYVCPNGVRVSENAGAIPVRPGRLGLVAVGRAEEAKDPQFFVDIVRGLRARGVDASATWVGDGPLLSELRRTAGDCCDFVGLSGSVEEHIRAADCVVSTSRREALPISLLDGMAAGRPVWARAVGGIPDLVLPETGMLWSTEAGVEEVIEAALPYALDACRLQSAGSAAREVVRSQYNDETMIDRLIEVFEEVVNGS